MMIRAKKSPNPPIPKVYVMQINKDPILAFEAVSLHEARALMKEAWFRTDLRGQRSGGAEVWNGKAALQVGPAAGEQLNEVRMRLIALRGAVEVPIIYLIHLDPRA